MRSRILLLFFVAVLPASAQSFADLQAAVQATPPSGHASLVNTFLAQARVPHFENDTTAVFLWKGSANSVAVTGDMNGWSAQGRALQRLSATDLWYRIEHFEADARLDYKLIRNGSDWILDPRNPNRVPGGFGSNSELAMPAYVQPWEITENPAVAKGTLTSHTFTSSVMGNSRKVQVYTPAEYDVQRAEPYPVILYHDGSDYTRLGSIKNILDNLIAAGRIEPLVAVFADPLDRELEYWHTSAETHTSLVVEELMPWVAATYYTSTDRTRRAVTGPSLAGLAAARHCFTHPEVFGLCAPISPSLWASNRALLNQMSQSDLTGITWYVDWGTYEASIAITGWEFESVLARQGASFRVSEWHEGHSWGSWRAHQDTMLEYFFPGVNATSRSSVEPPSHGFDLSLYPNPTSGRTTIAFHTPDAGPVQVAVFDIVGRRVAMLHDGTLPPGSHRTEWNPAAHATGTYLVHVTAGSSSISRLLAVAP